MKKEEPVKSKVSRTKEIIEFRVEINEIANSKSIENNNKIKTWFFVKTSEFDKPLSRLRKKEGYTLLISEMKKGHHCRSHGHPNDNKIIL